MEGEGIRRDFKSLPLEAQQQVADFVAFPRSCCGAQSAEKGRGRMDLADEPLVGIGKDREEMRESTSWVREAREREWGRCDRHEAAS